MRQQRRYSKRRTSRRRKATYHALRPRGFLLTRNEAAFFRALADLVGNRFVISCKVRLADLVNCSDRDWQRGAANRISQKHVDFVLSCPRSSRIVAAIELDDRSHDRPERRRRGDFFNALFLQMRVRLIRIQAQATYDSSALSNRFANVGL